MGEERGVYRVLVGKPEGKRTLGRPRRRWVDNIRTDLQEVGCGYVDWIGLAQDRDKWRTLVSAVMNLRVPWNAGNFLTSCKPVSCSGRTLHHGVHVHVRSLYERYVTLIRFDGKELLAPRPTPRLDDHPLSAVRDRLFNIFAATLHIGGRSSIRNLRTRHAVVTGTHLSRYVLWERYLNHIAFQNMWLFNIILINKNTLST